MVFDKTGTLTEDGLEVTGYRTVSIKKDNVYGEFTDKINALYPTNKWWIKDINNEYHEPNQN